jgi:hypothetical protein
MGLHVFGKLMQLFKPLQTLKWTRTNKGTDEGAIHAVGVVVLGDNEALFIVTARSWKPRRRHELDSSAS